MKIKLQAVQKIVLPIVALVATPAIMSAQTCGSFAAISKSAIGYHTVGIKTDGTLWAWGYNSAAQLGIGTLSNQNIPVQIGTANNWWQVTIGGTHSFAIKRDSTLWAWGDNTYGQLGDGTLAGKSTPLQIAVGTKWVAMSAGQNFSVGIQANGTIWAWGINNNGQLGDGTNTNRSIPTQIGTATDWAKVSCGVSHVMAIRANGSLWGWGLNGSAQLGDGTYTDRNTPVAIATGSTWQSVAGAWLSSSAIKTDGTLWGWGANGNGQLGNGDNYPQTQPVQAGTATNWKDVCAGNVHCLGLKTNGTLWAWGDNGIGELGDGTNTSTNSPIQIATANTWSAVGIGAIHSSAIRVDGALSTWGYNFYGAIGNGSNTASNNPVNISNNNTLNIATVNTSQTLPVLVSTTFFNGVTCNNLITTVTPSGPDPINGSTTAKVWIDNTQPADFVKRHYEIAPLANMANATGHVVLYFTQQEFDAFNAVNTIKLPLGPTDAAGKANLRIEKRNGTSADNTGSPLSYIGNAAFINPADTAILWNSAKSRWEVTIAASGMGGFFAGTSQTLNFNNCTGNVYTLTEGTSGTNYQWQADSGAGFAAIANGGLYTGAGSSTLIINGPSSSIAGTNFRCLVDGVPGPVYTIKFEVTWLGGTSTNWFTSSNWSGCGIVPDSNTSVIIPAGRPNSPVVNASTAIRGLKNQSGSSITVQTGAVLTILK